MKAKRDVTIFCEEYIVLGVNFEPAFDCGLYLLAVSSSVSRGGLRRVIQLLGFCSPGSILILRVSQVFVVGIFCTIVKPVDLQWVII
jgi:hypothetical protein